MPSSELSNEQYLAAAQTEDAWKEAINRLQAILDTYTDGSPITFTRALNLRDAIEGCGDALRWALHRIGQEAIR